MNEEIYVMDISAPNCPNSCSVYKQGRYYNVYEKILDDETQEIIEEPRDIRMPKRVLIDLYGIVMPQEIQKL